MSAKKNSIILLILVLIAALQIVACSKPPQEAPATETAEPSPATEGALPEAATTPGKEDTQTETSEPAVAKDDEAVQPEAQPVEKAEQPPATIVSETKPGETDSSPAQVEPIPAETAAPSAENTDTYKGALPNPIAEQPVLLTSAGQSADVQMVKVLLDRAKIKYIISPVVKSEEMKDIKSLILAVGGSSKGLGAAGIDAKEELERINAVISKAKELKLKIITMHIGGEARRGELSDKFINACVPVADYVIVVSEGNKDDLFTKLTEAGSIPMDIINKITEAAEPLKSAFK